MRRPCISGRYSTERQNETSLEVQVRNCVALAARDGLTVDDRDIYLDHAVSGQAKATAHRTAWNRLLDAWDAGLVSVVYANELSRLTRDSLEGAQLKRRVQRTGVHVVTCDGIDTRRPGWELMWDMMMAVCGQEVRYVAQRTSDSMLGVARRGGMLAAPAFGYQLDPMRRAAEEKTVGARWVVHEGNSALVREMYARRRAGEPHCRIAAWLNQQGIPSPRKGRDGQPASWRQSTVQRLLSNPIYRGLLVHNGSPYTRARLRRERNQEPETAEFPREHLRLVDDETWSACNPPKGQRLRGGVRHCLVGLLRCGDCGCKLSFKFSPTGGAASCPSCEHAVKAAAAQQWMGYTSVGAATAAMAAALRELFSPPVMDELRGRIRSRLSAPKSEEETELTARAKQLRGRQERLVQLAANAEVGADAVVTALEQVSRELRDAERRLEELKREQGLLTAAELKRHLVVDVGPLLDKLLGGGSEMHEVRAVLSRLVTRFALVARPRRGESVFEVEFVPGAATAEAAAGVVVDKVRVAFRVDVRYRQGKAQKWSTEVTRL